MTLALTSQLTVLSLMSSHSCSLFPSDGQFHIPLCCHLGVMLTFFISKWLSEEIRDSYSFPSPPH